MMFFRVILASIALALSSCGAEPAFAGESPTQFWLHNDTKPWQLRSMSEVSSHVRSLHTDLGQTKGATMVDDAARRVGVPVNIARAILRVESGGNCHARSPAGAIGAMQVLPATARAMGVSGPLTVCANSVEAGVRYLRRIIDAHGTGCGALSLYEMGEFARPICTGYGLKVLAFAR